jgi:hypothetical protein
MQLVNEFTVSQPIDDSWALLTDVERIAPCMPGAQLTEVEGDVYRGKVTVKVGPMLARFAGQAEFRELDRDAQRVVLEARGKESGGKGMANAVITAQLTEQGTSTLVQVTTDLTISGRLAQFGQGALGDISNKLLGQFVDCLEHRLAGDEPAEPQRPAPRAPDAAATSDTGGAAAEPERPGPPEERRLIQSPDALPVNLLQTAGVPIVKRLAPPLALVAVLVGLVMLARRRRR